jgi:hypothetical protein
MKCATCASQRQTHSLECNLRIGLTLRNAVNRGQFRKTSIPRAAISIHAYIDGLLYGWLLAPDSLSCIRRPSAGLIQDWICCA